MTTEYTIVIARRDYCYKTREASNDQERKGNTGSLKRR